MDLKPTVARLAADCDLRTRLVRNVPGILDNYVLSGSGELLTKKEADRSYAINFFLDGLDFVSSQVRQ